MKRNPLQTVDTSVILEHSRMNREKSVLVVDKSILIYFSFLLVAVFGFSTGHIEGGLLNFMFILAFSVLIVGFISYLITMHKEEKRLTALLYEPVLKRGVKK